MLCTADREDKGIDYNKIIDSNEFSHRRAQNGESLTKKKSCTLFTLVPFLWNSFGVEAK